MNQILSVEMPNKNTKRVKNANKKASTKSVVIFFSIILLLFGVALIALGIYGFINDNNSKAANLQNKPRIDVTQNATELEIEILGKAEIVKAEYSWSNSETKEVQGNGTNSLEISIDIPSGVNTFEIIATDVKGITNEYTKQFVGPKEPNIQLVEQEQNKIQLICQEEQIIKNISYYYDDEAEITQEVNDNSVQLDIDVMQGEHVLTIKVEYEDGTIGSVSKKLFVPNVNVTTDGNSFFVTASDVRKITNVTMNFNGEETEIKDINSETFEKTLQLQNGENRLILTIYNSDGGKIIKKTRWEKK